MRHSTVSRRRGCDAAKISAALAAWLMGAGIVVSGGAAEMLRVGTAVKDITPAKPVMLAGYASRKDLSRGIHDPLSARVVAFEQNGKKLVLVSTEILGFYGGTAASMRKAILKGCGLQPSELFLAAVHTHAAPIVTLHGGKIHPNNTEYTQTLQTQLVAAVREALARTVPAQITVGSGSSPIGVNRREFVKDSVGKTRVVLGRNPSVMTDREVQVLRVTRAEKGDVAAVVFAYATHSTCMGPRNYLVSGDIHGLAAQFLEKQLNGGVVAPAFAGASGNIDPWFRILSRFNADRNWVPEAVLMSTMLGEEVVHVLEGMKKPSPSGPIKTVFKAISPPRKKRGPVDATEEESPEFNITVGRLGDVAMVGLGGEVFNEIGTAIKTASPFPCTLIITHCNGAAGYLPTKEAYPEGGYEVESSPFAPGAADEVVEQTVRLLKELRSEP